MYTIQRRIRNTIKSLGNPQASVFGPPLWKIMHDDMLKIKLSPGAEIVALADDVGLVIT